MTQPAKGDGLSIAIVLQLIAQYGPVIAELLRKLFEKRQPTVEGFSDACVTPEVQVAIDNLVSKLV